MNVLTRTSDGIAGIQIARPERKNAITEEMYAALADALQAAERDASVRAILLHGQADVFTAGNDIQDFLRRPPRKARTRRCSASWPRWRERSSRWWPRSTAWRWASAPRCCCIAIWCTAPTIHVFRFPS